MSRCVMFVACRKGIGRDDSTMAYTEASVQNLVKMIDSQSPEWAKEHPVFEIIPVIETFEP